LIKSHGIIYRGLVKWKWLVTRQSCQLIADTTLVSAIDRHDCRAS